MIRKLFYFLLVFLVLLTPVQAQNKKPQGVVYLCIVPTLEDGTRGVPYLVGFRLVTLVGFVVSEDATVTVYNDPGAAVVVGVHHILPDAQTGGYRRVGRVATAYTTTNVPAPRDCAAEYPELITPDMLATLPLTVSIDQAMIVQVGGNALLDESEILGSTAFHFMGTTPESQKNIQVMQLTESAIDLSFPFLKEDTGFVLLANKNITVKRSFTENEADFLSQKIGNEHRGFISEMERESLDLFKIMSEGFFRIYPASGLLEVYPTQGFLRLEMPASPARRNPPFEANQTVGALTIKGVKARYYLEGRADALGSLETTSRPIPVVNVDDDGQLIVTASNQTVIIEAWLVEVKP